MNYGTMIFARREIARYMAVWGQTVVPPLVTAALILFVFGHALGNRIGVFDGVPYLAYIAPGLIIQGAIVNAYNNNASSLFDSRRARYIEDVLTSPLTDARIVLAYVLSGTSRGAIIGVLTLVVALPVTDGWNVNLPLFVAVLLLACIVFALLGVLAGLRATRWDHIFVPITFILTPLTFLGGMFYPVSELSPRLEAASRFNPILYLVDAQRQSLLGIGEFALWPLIGGIAVAAGGLWWGTVRAFSTSRKLRG